MSRTSQILFAGATFALAAGVVPSAIAAAEGGPVGNNGTVKIDGIAFDDAPDNEPHVGCKFQVDWYGFDANATSDVTFELQPPTTLAGKAPFQSFKQLDGDDNSGGGSEAGLDGSQQYDLRPLVSGVKAHPIQGYHVKLTINTTTSIGADVKHKVFWVTGCVDSGSN